MLLNILGLLAEIIGVMLMANAYLQSTRLIQTPWILLKCLWSVKTVTGLVAIKDLETEDSGKVLRGLAFIAIGFVLQLLGVVFS